MRLKPINQKFKQKSCFQAPVKPQIALIKPSMGAKQSEKAVSMSWE